MYNKIHKNKIKAKKDHKIIVKETEYYKETLHRYF